MTNLKAIGARVKWLRKQRHPKESQDQLAAAIGVTRSAIAGIESGGDRGGLETMIAIADYYKVPLDWLLCRPSPVGGPLVGEFINDPDELAIAHFWRRLGDDGRAAAVTVLRIDRRDTGSS
jgi:transcriptional regulator with XRE-family HTH domain